MPEPVLSPLESPDLPGEATTRHVFVYGTLRRGDDNDITRLAPAPRFVGMGSIAGVMYHLGRYPGVALGRHGDAAEGVVVGEVYAIGAELERILDEIEEVYPQQTDEYAKRQVTVTLATGSLVCIVYEINPIYLPGMPVIASGDWVKDRAMLATGSATALAGA